MIKKTSGSCNTRRTAPSLRGFQQGRNEGGPPHQKRPPRGLLALIIFLKALYAHFGGPGRTDGADGHGEDAPTPTATTLDNVVLYGTP